MLQFFKKADAQESEFQPFDNFYRMRKVQKLCNKENVDGLLIINGIDSKENPEYIKLMNWLFLGHSGIEVESNEILESSLNESIILIMKDRVRVFLDQAGYKFLSKFIFAYPNIDLFVTTEAQEYDTDLFELIKVAQFIKMLKDLTTIGILLPTKHKQIEKWPIIQSYGLLDKGFFSMNYKISKLNDRINGIYNSHDKHSLKRLIYVTQQKLLRQNNGVLASLIEFPPKKRRLQTSESLNEILITSFEIEENKYVRNKESKPQIHYGQHQLIIDSHDLFTSMSFARTYFLSRQVQTIESINQIMSDENYLVGYEFQVSQNIHYEKEKYLYELYRDMCQILHSALVMISQDYRKMTQQFVLQLANHPDIKNGSVRLNIRFKAINSFGESQAINFKDSISFKLTPQFFIIRLDIQNIAYQNDSLGSLLVSDSFILQENCFMLLTKDIGYFKFINTDGSNQDNIENLKKRLQLPELGLQLSDKFEKNQLFFSADVEIDIQITSIILHEKGLRVHTPELGWCIIFFNKLSNVQFTQGLEHVWMLTDYEILGPFNRVGLCFRGKSAEAYMKLVLILQEQQIPFTYTKQPFDLTINQIGRGLLNIKESVHLKGNEVVDEHFLLSYLESKQLSILNEMKDLKLMHYLNQKELQQQIPNIKYQLILITGNSSSGKSKFASSLQRYAMDFNQRADLLQFSLQEQHSLDEEGWINKLTSISKPGVIMICVIPFYLQIDDILNAISKNKDYLIRCIINKVNINNLQSKNKTIQHGLISQCLPGFAQFVALDSFGVNEKEVDEVHKILRSICKNNVIFRQTNNMIQQAIAKEIYENTNYSNQQQLRNIFGALRVRNQNYSKLFIPSSMIFQTKLRKEMNDFLKDSFGKDFEKQDEIGKLHSLINLIPKDIYIKGFVRLENQYERLFEFTGNQNYVIDRQCKINIQIRNEKEYKIPSYPGWDHHGNLGFLIIGQFDKQTILNVICQWQVQLPSLQPYQTVVSDEVIKELEYKNLHVGLDNGEFFDGVLIRNQDGIALKEHPLRKQFVDEYLNIQNLAIKAQNDAILLKWQEFIDVYKL